MSWGPGKTTVFALGLPRGVILGGVLISFVGRSQVSVENCRSISIYVDTLIKLQARGCRVVTHGAHLKIGYYTAGEMKITGQVGSLEFETQIKGETCLIEWLLCDWGGYARLRLHDYLPGRFLSLRNARGLEAWGLICSQDGDYEFFMAVEGYYRVKPLVHKA